MATINLKKLLISTAILLSSLLLSYALIAQATSKEDISFPVAELGNCQNQAECRAYCDQPDNFSACFAFARKHNLLEGPLAKESEEKLDKFAGALKDGGPGGCKTHQGCEAFCNNTDNISACIDWAERNGVFSGRELEEAKRVKQALDRGAKLPGNCRNKNECERYCGSGDNIDECLAFAEESRFLPQEELEKARKFAEYMKRGETPGGCRSEEQCERYCFEEDHLEECVAFAEKAGFASKEEVEMFKKTGGRGPGGCRGRACETYCNDPAHQEECFNWAKEHGVLREEDLQRARDGAQQFRQHIQQMPPEVTQCLKETVGEEVLNKLESGEFIPPRDLGEKMRTCFEKFARNQAGQFRHEADQQLLPEEHRQYQHAPEQSALKEEEYRRQYQQHQEHDAERSSLLTPTTVSPSAPANYQQYQHSPEQSALKEQEIRQQYEQQYQQEVHDPALSEQKLQEQHDQEIQSKAEPPTLGEFLLGMLANLLF